MIVVPASLLEQINCTPISSGSFRRRAQAKQKSACADTPGYRECPVRIGSHNKVCVDTRSEIEYCGPECENCLTKIGVSDVGCVDGACVAASCDEGYALRDGTCVAG